jgi:alpha-ketoglutarate-dependent taurine dioxygenase
MTHLVSHGLFGLQLGPDDVIPPNLAELVHKNAFVLFRGKSISDAEFTVMAESLGRPIEYGFGKILNMEAREDAIESQFSNAGMALHTDAVLNREHSALFLNFKCYTAPKKGGGETLFTNNRHFLEIIPQSLLAELRSVTIAYRARTAGYYSGGGGNEGAPIMHRAITRHPRTGEEALFIALDDPDDECRNYEAAVVGYERTKSRQFMKEVDTWLRHPDVLRPHAWQEGDVLIVDNFLACHGRAPFQKGDKRRIIRIAIAA